MVVPRIPRSLEDLVLSVVEHARRYGLGVSTSEAEEALRMLRTYCALKGKIDEGGFCRPTLNEVVRILEACFMGRPHDKYVLRRALQASLSEVKGAKRSAMRQIEEALKELGLDFGYKSSLSRRITRNQRVLKAYATLRCLGVIRREGRHLKVMSRSYAMNVVKSMRAHGLDDIYSMAMTTLIRRLSKHGVRKLSDELNLLRFLRIPRGMLRTLPSRRLIELYDLVERWGSRDQARDIAIELSVRAITAPHKLKGLDHVKLLKILSSHRLLSDDVLRGLITIDPKVFEYSLRNDVADLNRLLQVYENLNPQVQSKVLRTLCSYSSLRPIIRDLLMRTSPLAFNGLNPDKIPLSVEERRLLHASSRMANALSYVCKFSVRRGYVDMALEEYEKARSIAEGVKATSALSLKLRRDLEFLESLCGALLGCRPLAELDMLVNGKEAMLVIRALREVYRSTDDDDLKRSAIRLATKIAHILRRRIRASARPLKRVTLKGGRGRLLPRRTIFNIIRHRSNPLVCEVKKPRRRVALVVDVSGSMSGYTEWAILIASAFYKFVDSLILFSDKVQIIEPRKLRNVSDMVRLLFDVEFTGWTDIARAMKIALIRSTRRRAEIVLISDLRQTVVGENPEDVFREALMRRRKIMVIAPPTCDREMYLKLSELGLQVTVVNEPSELPKLLALPRSPP